MASQVKTSNGSKLTLYLKELRAPFLSASLLPIILGALMSPGNLKNSVPLFLLTLLCGALIHLAANTFNDYYDFRQGADTIEVRRTPFSGGSGLLTEKQLTPGDVLMLSVGLLGGVAVTSSLILALGRGNPLVVLMLGLAALFLGICYTAPPFRLCYRGWGEIAILVAFGPLPVFTAYYILSGEVSLPPVIASLPLGLMTTAILWINQFPDLKTDEKAGKRTLLVRIGLARGRYVYYLLVALSTFSLFASVYLGYLPKPALLGLLFLAPAVPPSRLIFRHYGDPQKLVPAMGLTIAAHSTLGILMIIGTLL